MSKDGYFFPPGSVVWDLASLDKFDAIRETVARTAVLQSVEGLDASQFAETVVAREREQSTGFGHGIAIAHGRTEHVSRSSVLLGISRAGIDFASFDGMPVHLLFVVASNPDHCIDYLKILSSIATMSRNDRFRHEMLSCIGQDEVQEKIRIAFRGVMQRSAAG